jgi:hypothetical protein
VNQKSSDNTPDRPSQHLIASEIGKSSQKNLEVGPNGKISEPSQRSGLTNKQQVSHGNIHEAIVSDGANQNNLQDHNIRVDQPQ